MKFTVENAMVHSPLSIISLQRACAKPLVARYAKAIQEMWVCVSMWLVPSPQVFPNEQFWPECHIWLALTFHHVQWCQSCAGRRLLNRMCSNWVFLTGPSMYEWWAFMGQRSRFHDCLHPHPLFPHSRTFPLATWGVYASVGGAGARF